MQVNTIDHRNPVTYETLEVGAYYYRMGSGSKSLYVKVNESSAMALSTNRGVMVEIVSKSMVQRVIIVEATIDEVNSVKDETIIA